MSQVLKPYKGYIGQIEPDVATKMISGQVINLRDTIAFEGKTVDEAEESFHRSIDAYIAFCEKHHLDPEKSFAGNIPFRTTPELHRLIFTASRLAKRSMNAWMEGVLAEAAKKAIEASPRMLV